MGGKKSHWKWATENKNARKKKTSEGERYRKGSVYMSTTNEKNARADKKQAIYH